MRLILSLIDVLRGAGQAIRGHPCPLCGSRVWLHWTERIWTCGACYRRYDPRAGRLAGIVAAALLLSGPSHAVTLAEFLTATADFRAIYSAGAIDAYVHGQDPAPDQSNCVIHLKVQPVYDEIAALLAKHPQLADHNAAAVLLSVIHRRCGTR